MNNELRILHVITDLGKGGAERALLDMCEYMITQPGVRIKILSLYPLNEYKESFSKFDVEIAHFETFSLRKKNENSVYKNILYTFKPHIVHSHRFLGEFLTSYYVNPEIHYVCHGHDNMIQLRRPTFKDLFSKEKLLMALERRHLILNKYRKVPTYFIANSPDTQVFYKRELPQEQQGNVSLIPYGFNFNRFENPKPKSLHRGNILQFVNVGSFQVKKNQRFILDIALELKARSIAFEVHLLGDGSERPRIEKLAQEKKLTECVHFHGMVNNVEEWYRKADLYIHTAHYEPFGLVFLEAMAARLPVICLNGKGNAFIIENGKNGYIFNEEDPKQFADAIESLIQDPKAYSEMSAYAREYSKNYDRTIQSQKLLAFYRTLTQL